MLRLKGAYSIVVLDAESPDRLVVARQASPLVIGMGEEANFIASDMPAILGHTRRMLFMEDGTMAVVKADGIELTQIADGSPAEAEVKEISWSPTMAE